jgi:hypothetical protein
MEADRFRGLDEIHPDLTSIMKSAESGITKEAYDQIGQDFEKIEATMWESEGDPDGDAQLYVVYEMVDSTDTAGLVITPFGTIGENVYTMLKDPALCKEIAENNTLGLILRCGGKAKDKDNLEAEGDNVALSVLVCGTGIFAVTRLIDKDEIVRSSERLDHIYDRRMDDDSVDGLSGMGKLADQMILSYVVPPLLKQNKPDLYAEIIKHVK